MCLQNPESIQLIPDVKRLTIPLGDLGRSARVVDRMGEIFVLLTQTKGREVALTLHRFNQLCVVMEDVQVAAQLLSEEDIPNLKLRLHLGSNYHVSVTSGYSCVDVRRFYVPKGKKELQPTRCGMALRLREWADLYKALPSIKEGLPELVNFVPCYLGPEHEDKCKTCYPNDQ